MSEFKTNKISPRKGTTTTIGDSGDSVSTSGGSTITNAGSITTAGITGGTINNTTGEIYLRGEVDWKPGDIKTASFTATDNQGFFVNTTSGEITVTLPASPSAGDVVGIKDYANTFDTNKCILNPNGNKIQGSTTNFNITVEGSSIIIIYVDSTKGWVITDASKAADITEDIKFVTATGGTITTCGDFKIHKFTGPGTFTVSCAGNAAGSNSVDYLVVAGGGSGGVGSSDLGGSGGGAGGYRESHSTPVSGSYTASPLATPTALTVTATAFPITIGAGGTSSSGNSYPGVNSGSNSVFFFYYLSAAVKPVVLTVVCQLTWLSIVPVIETPVIVPVFVIVPEFCKAPPLVKVTPAGIATVSPLSPSVTVPQFAVGVILLTLTSLILPYCSWTNFIYFYFTHNLPIEICTLLLLYLNRLIHR